MKRLNPRIVRRKDGSALLTGIAYSDLCHILTLASNRQYDAERDHRDQTEPEAEADVARFRAQGNVLLAEAVERNICEERIFHRRIRAILDMIKARTSPRYCGDDGAISLLPRWQALRRLEAAKDATAFRRRLKAIIFEARNG